MKAQTIASRQVYMLIGLAVILDLVRIVLFGSSSFNYLLWNIFLAALPFMVSMVLLRFQTQGRLSTLLLIAGSILWLLLLPNAPYIITDLVHVGYGHVSAVFYDMILIFSCALAGLCLGLYSLSHMHTVFKTRYGNRVARILIVISMFLASFGIALGRFLRFNSWDIFTNTGVFLENTGSIFLFPHEYIHIYIITGTFFLFLLMTYDAFGFNK